MTALSLARPVAVMIILFWVFGGAVDAAGFENLDRIRDRAAAVAGAQLPAEAEIEVGQLDPRLRLPACDAPLAGRELTRTASAIQVEVGCPTLGWKLYVPVTVRLQVPVLVALRPLLRGAPVGASDVEVQMRDRAGLGSAWLDHPDQLANQVASRAIAAGSLLQPHLLAAEQVVRRGQSVTLVGGAGLFQVRSQGKALADAAIGDLIRVENAGSRRVVQGRVMADGSVQVGL